LVESSEITLKNNPKMANRFTYQVALYQFKLQALRGALNGDIPKI